MKQLIISISLIISFVAFSQHIPKKKLQNIIKPKKDSVNFKLFYKKELITRIKENHTNNIFNYCYLKIKLNPNNIEQYLGYKDHNTSKINYEILGSYQFIKLNRKLKVLTPKTTEYSYKYQVEELFLNKKNMYGKIKIFDTTKVFRFIEE